MENLLFKFDEWSCVKNANRIIFQVRYIIISFSFFSFVENFCFISTFYIWKHFYDNFVYYVFKIWNSDPLFYFVFCGSNYYRTWAFLDRGEMGRASVILVEIKGLYWAELKCKVKSPKARSISPILKIFNIFCHHFYLSYIFCFLNNIWFNF